MARTPARIVIEWLVLLLLSLTLVAWLVLQHPLATLDHYAFDRLLPAIARKVPDDVVIVAIDRATMNTIKSWPYKRSVHAELLERLTEYQPAAIAFDMLFYESMSYEDVLFAKAMQQSPPVFLPMAFESVTIRQNRALFPVDTLREQATEIGHIHIEVSSDNSVREVYLWQGINAPSIPHLSLAMCRFLSEQCKEQNLPPTLNRSAEGINGRWLLAGYRMIPYAGPPGSFTKVSYIDVLEGKIDKAMLENKIIFVGTTDMMLGDYYMTPTSWSAVPMQGVEILANIFDMLRQPRVLHGLSPGYHLIFSSVIVFTALLYLLFAGSRGNIMLLFFYMVGTLFLSIVLLRLFWIWFSPINLWLAMLVLYPLWTWRRLEAFQRDLDDRIHQLLNIPMLLTEHQSFFKLPVIESRDGLQNRIERLKLIADRLRDVQALIQYGLNSFPGTMLITDSNWFIALMNQHAKTQADTLDPYQGQSLIDFLRSLGVPEVADLKASLQSVVDRKQIVTFLIRGTGTFYLTSVSPCYMGVSSVISLVVCVLDVSIWQRAKETREDLMRFLSHDIRSPIASIIMALDDANLKTDENEEKQELLNRVKQAAERSLKLADNFLHLAKAESIDPERFVERDLFDVIEVAIDELWPQAKQAGIKLVFDQTIPIQEEGAWVVGDRDLLIRVVINLGLNAIKYSPADTTVSFSIERGGQFWIIHVADQGMGIAQEQFSQIFNKFGRIRQQDGNYKSGIGLGLMIVKTVVDRHHGHMSVQSVIGKGSCFSVHLPLVPAPDFEDE